MVVIPFSNSQYPSFVQEISLEEKVYKFRFYWNDRFDYWSMAILNFEDTIVLSGIKLVLNYELIQRYRHRDIPQGQLYVIDPSDTLVRIGREDLDNTVNLIYVEVEDFATL